MYLPEKSAAVPGGGSGITPGTAEGKQYSGSTGNRRVQSADFVMKTEILRDIKIPLQGGSCSGVFHFGLTRSNITDHSGQGGFEAFVIFFS